MDIAPFLAMLSKTWPRSREESVNIDRDASAGLKDVDRHGDTSFAERQ